MTPSSSATPVFERVAQDKHADNTGDHVKEVVSESCAALRPLAAKVRLLDSHAGAGCYPTSGAPGGPYLSSHPYFERMSVLAAKVAAGGLRIRREDGAPDDLPGYLGLAPMLIDQLGDLLASYHGFETSRLAGERLRATLEQLEVDPAVIDLQTGPRADGWKGVESLLTSAPPDDRATMVVIDPMSLEKEAERVAVTRMVALLGMHDAPAVVAVFNPGTTKNNPAAVSESERWLRWDLVTSQLQSSLPGGWYHDAFQLRRSASKGLATFRGRVQHYGMELISNRPSVLRAVRRAWDGRWASDTTFRRWADPR